MNAILGDDDRLEALAEDFAKHYEKRVAEGSTVKGKAMFVCASREIAWDFYRQLKDFRPAWFEVNRPRMGLSLPSRSRKSCHRPKWSRW
jgi:type I restriction enzyme R subunit